MTTPIKVLVSEFQARKISTGNQTVIIQIRRKAGEPVRKFKAKLCDVEEIRPPYLEPLVGQGIISPVDALYEQYVEEITRYMGHDGTSERRELASVGKRFFGPKFRGVFSNSEAESVRLTEGKPYMLVNTGEVGHGEHWQAIAYSKNGGDVLYDSLGGGDTNPDAEQGVSDDDCGQRSLAWLRVVDQLGLEMAMRI